MDNLLMGLKEVLNSVHALLDGAGLEHALIGGMGLASLGVHRATHDVDFLIHGKDHNTLKAVMQRAGWKLELETADVLHFSGFGQVDFLLAKRPYSQQMLKESTVGKAFGIRHVSPEAIIGLKIQAYKNDSKRELQDKADIGAIIQKYPVLDWNLVKTYADLFSEWKFIQSLKDRS